MAFVCCFDRQFDHIYRGRCFTDVRSNVSGFESENGLRRSIGNHRLPDSHSETGFRLLPIEHALINSLSDSALNNALFLNEFFESTLYRLYLVIITSFSMP